MRAIVIDGNIATAAGVTSGIDGALAVAALVRGEATAEASQLDIQYAPDPPFHAGSPEIAPAPVLAAGAGRLPAFDNRPAQYGEGDRGKARYQPLLTPPSARLPSRRCCVKSAAMLHLNELTFRLGPRLLFDKATAALPERARVGFVGRNGAGKTTLFNMIAGDLSPDTGDHSRCRADARLGRVEQEAPGGPAQLLDFVLAADTERAALLDRSGDGERPASHRRYPDAARRYRRACSARPAPRIFSPASASTMRRRAVRYRNFPAAGGCASRSPRCSFPPPTCCCSTSRPIISISKARSG